MSLKYVDKPRMSDKVRINNMTNMTNLNKNKDKIPLRKEYYLSNLKYRCGTVYPGWLIGSHPTVTEGVVTRTVRYSYRSDCFWRSNIIKVKNCSSYYVYELPRTGDRYCGNAGAGKLH